MLTFIHADKDELNFPPSTTVARTLASLSIDVMRRYQKEPELLDVLARKHGCSKERLFLDAGVIGIIHRVFDALLTSNSKILLPELGFPYYHTLARRKNIPVIPFAFKKKEHVFEYDVDDLLRKLAEKPEILVLIDPESPLGFSIPQEVLEAILRAADPHTLIFLDQTHEGFRERHIKNIVSLTETFPNLLVARSFSKFYGLAGVRIAYALCGKDVKERIHFVERYLGFDNCAQQLAIAALQSENHYKENAHQIREQKARCMSALQKLKGYQVFETDHASVVVTVPEEQNTILTHYAHEAGILIRHLGGYHPSLVNFYRITMCPADEMNRVIDIFESVAWLYELDVVHATAASKIHTRNAGYTVHRKELIYEKSGIIMGLHHAIIPPGKSVPAHTHDEQDELFEFHSRAYFELHGQRFEVKPGDWVQVQAGETHYVEALPDYCARFVPLRFPYQPEKKQAGYDPTEQ